MLLTYRGAGNRLTPELRDFFIKAGVPASLLEALPAIANEIRYHSAFVAYGEPDLAFAKRLYGDLLSKGVSCWMFTLWTPRQVGQPGMRLAKSGEKPEGSSFSARLQDSCEMGRQKEIEDQMDDDPDKIIPISRDDLWRAPGFQVQRSSTGLESPSF